MNCLDTDKGAAVEVGAPLRLSSDALSSRVPRLPSHTAPSPPRSPSLRSDSALASGAEEGASSGEPSGWTSCGSHSPSFGSPTMANSSVRRASASDRGAALHPSGIEILDNSPGIPIVTPVSPTGEEAGLLAPSSTTVGGDAAGGTHRSGRGGGVHGNKKRNSPSESGGIRMPGGASTADGGSTASALGICTPAMMENGKAPYSQRQPQPLSSWVEAGEPARRQSSSVVFCHNAHSEDGAGEPVRGEAETPPLLPPPGATSTPPPLKPHLYGVQGTTTLSCGKGFTSPNRSPADTASGDHGSSSTTPQGRCGPHLYAGGTNSLIETMSWASNHTGVTAGGGSSHILEVMKGLKSYQGGVGGSPHSKENLPFIQAQPAPKMVRDSSSPHAPRSTTKGEGSSLTGKSSLEKGAPRNPTTSGPIDVPLTSSAPVRRTSKDVSASSAAADSSGKPLPSTKASSVKGSAFTGHHPGSNHSHNPRPHHRRGSKNPNHSHNNTEGGHSLFSAMDDPPPALTGTGYGSTLQSSVNGRLGDVAADPTKSEMVSSSPNSPKPERIIAPVPASGSYNHKTINNSLSTVAALLHVKTGTGGTNPVPPVVVHPHRSNGVALVSVTGLMSSKTAARTQHSQSSSSHGVTFGVVNGKRKSVKSEDRRLDKSGEARVVPETTTTGSSNTAEAHIPRQAQNGNNEKGAVAVATPDHVGPPSATVNSGSRRQQSRLIDTGGGASSNVDEVVAHPTTRAARSHTCTRANAPFSAGLRAWVAQSRGEHGTLPPTLLLPPSTSTVSTVTSLTETVNCTNRRPSSPKLTHLSSPTSRGGGVGPSTPRNPPVSSHPRRRSSVNPLELSDMMEPAPVPGATAQSAMNALVKGSGELTTAGKRAAPPTGQKRKSKSGGEGPQGSEKKASNQNHSRCDHTAAGNEEESGMFPDVAPHSTFSPSPLASAPLDGEEERPSGDQRPSAQHNEGAEHDQPPQQHQIVKQSGMSGQSNKSSKGGSSATPPHSQKSPVSGAEGNYGGCGGFDHYCYLHQPMTSVPRVVPATVFVPALMHQTPIQKMLHTSNPGTSVASTSPPASTRTSIGDATTSGMSTPNRATHPLLRHPVTHFTPHPQGQAHNPSGGTQVIWRRRTAKPRPSQPPPKMSASPNHPLALEAHTLPSSAKSPDFGHTLRVSPSNSPASVSEAAPSPCASSPLQTTPSSTSATGRERLPDFRELDSASAPLQHQGAEEDPMGVSSGFSAKEGGGRSSLRDSGHTDLSVGNDAGSGGDSGALSHCTTTTTGNDRQPPVERSSVSRGGTYGVGFVRAPTPTGVGLPLFECPCAGRRSSGTTAPPFLSFKGPRGQRNSVVMVVSEDSRQGVQGTGSPAVAGKAGFHHTKRSSSGAPLSSEHSSINVAGGEERLDMESYRQGPKSANVLNSSRDAAGHRIPCNSSFHGTMNNQDTYHQSVTSVYHPNTNNNSYDNAMLNSASEPISPSRGLTGRSACEERFMQFQQQHQQGRRPSRRLSLQPSQLLSRNDPSSSSFIMGASLEADPRSRADRGDGQESILRSPEISRYRQPLSPQQELHRLYSTHNERDRDRDKAGNYVGDNLALAPPVTSGSGRFGSGLNSTTTISLSVDEAAAEQHRHSQGGGNPNSYGQSNNNNSFFYAVSGGKRASVFSHLSFSSGLYSIPSTQWWGNNNNPPQTTNNNSVNHPIGRMQTPAGARSGGAGLSAVSGRPGSSTSGAQQSTSYRHVGATKHSGRTATFSRLQLSLMGSQRAFTKVSTSHSARISNDFGGFSSGGGVSSGGGPGAAGPCGVAEYTEYDGSSNLQGSGVLDGPGGAVPTSSGASSGAILRSSSLGGIVTLNSSPLANYPRHLNSPGQHHTTTTSTSLNMHGNYNLNANISGSGATGKSGVSAHGSPNHLRNPSSTSVVRVVPVVSEMDRSTNLMGGGALMVGPQHFVVTSEEFPGLPEEVGLYESPQLVFLPVYQHLHSPLSDVEAAVTETPPAAQFSVSGKTSEAELVQEGQPGSSVVLPLTPSLNTKRALGRVASRYDVDPKEELQICAQEGDAVGPDCKIEARLLLDADRLLMVSAQEEVGRYIEQPEKPRDLPNCSNTNGHGDEEERDGACDCDEYFIGKDYLGADCSRYHAHEMFRECQMCHRRPACFLCLHCLQSFCPLHVPDHYALDPEGCTLYMNILDIMTGFDRIFWCEKCKRFTWKYTEVFDAFVDQIAYTRGTYFDKAVRDIHCVWYQTVLRAPGELSSSSEEEDEEDMDAGAEFGGEEWQHVSEDDIAIPGSPGSADIVAHRLGAQMRRRVSDRSTKRLSHSRHNSLSPMYELLHRSFRQGSSVRNSLDVPAGMICPGQRNVVNGAKNSIAGVDGGVLNTSSCLPGTSPLVPPPLPPDVYAFNTSTLSAPPVAVPPPMLQRGSPPGVPANYSTVPPPAGGAGESPTIEHEPSSPYPGAGPTCLPTTATGEFHAESEDRMSPTRAVAVCAGVTGAGGEEDVLPVLGVGRAVSHLAALSASVQGWRTTQEDAEAVFLVGIPALFSPPAADGQPIPLGEGGAPPLSPQPVPALQTMQMAVYCVFDGHGGDAVAKLAAQNFETHLRRAIARTRTDDIRARALLYVLEDESTHPVFPQPQPTFPSFYESTRAFQSEVTVDGMGSASNQQNHLPGSDDTSPTRAGAPKGQPPTVSSAHSPGITEGGAEEKGGAPVMVQELTGLEVGSPHDPSPRSPFWPLQSVVPVTVSNLKQFTQHSGRGGKDKGTGQHHHHTGQNYHQMESKPKTTGCPESASPAGKSRHRPNRQTQSQGSYVEPASQGGGGEGETLRPEVCEFINQWQRHELDEDEKLVNPPQNTTSLRFSGGGYQLSAVGVSSPPISAGDPSFYGSPIGRSRHTVASTPAAVHHSSVVDNEAPFSPWSVNNGGGAGGVGDSPHPLPVRSGPGHLRGSHPGGGSSVLAAMAPTQVTQSEMDFLRCYFANIMEDALLSLDKSLETSEEGQRGDFNTVGCTACVVGITRNFILCANVGDSGAALYDQYTMEPISVTHRITDIEEQTRIEKAGYLIRDNRIEGLLAVPRALGDFDFKQCGGRSAKEQAVVALPDVTVRPVPSEGDGRWGVILACDGVWDTLTQHQVHHALTHTENDALVAAAVTEAVIRSRELAMEQTLMRKRTSGRVSQDQRHSSTAGGTEGTSSSRILFPDVEKTDPPATPPSDHSGGGGTAELGGAYAAGEHLNIPLLVAATGVFAQSIAPADNTEGIGLDNCSLIVIQNQPHGCGERPRQRKAGEGKRRARQHSTGVVVGNNTTEEGEKKKASASPSGERNENAGRAVTPVGREGKTEK